MFPLLSFELSNCLFAIGLCFVTQYRLFSDEAFLVVVVVVAAVSLLLVYIFAFRSTVNDCCNSIPIVRISIRSGFVSFPFISIPPLRFSTRSIAVSAPILCLCSQFFNQKKFTQISSDPIVSFNLLIKYGRICIVNAVSLSLNELVLSVLLLLLLLLLSVSAAAQVFNKDSI